MFTTSAFCSSLLDAVKNFMIENKVDIFPIDFLIKHPKGKTYKKSYQVACDFYNKGHWEYFFIKSDKLCLHINYRGEGGLGEYDYEVSPNGYTYGETGEAFKDLYHICTSDMVALIQLCYDTIGSSYFNGRG